MNAVVIQNEPIRLTELKTAMLLFVPFFASLMIDVLEMKVGKFPHIFGNNKATAATDGKFIYIDQDFLNSLKLPEAVFLLCHEIAHCMWAHMARGKDYLDQGFEGAPFDPALWNMAGDYVINDMLKASGIGDMPKGGLWDSKYPNTMLVEDVYRDLKKNPPQGMGGSPPDQYGNQGITLDVHILQPGQISEQELRRAVSTAAESAKAMGNMPGALKRFVETLVNPEVPWQEKLRFHVTRNAARDCTTWRKPHRRRLILQKVYLPSYTGYGAGKVVVAIDTSGSIGQRELNKFLGELAGILDDCKPEKTFVLACDADIDAVTELDEGHDVASDPPAMGGGGGTDFRPVFNWVEENCPECSTLVYFTDLMGCFPDEPPDYPVIWAATYDGQCPWGEKILLKDLGK